MLGSNIVSSLGELSESKKEDFNQFGSDLLKKLDKPLNNKIESLNIKEATEKKEVSRQLSVLDKPLNRETKEMGNKMSTELSEKVKGDLNNRSFEKLREKYPNLDKELDKIQKSLEEAKTPAERLAALNKLEKTKGRVMEILLKENLTKLFESSDQKQTVVDTVEGKTKPDVMLHGAKKDIIVGETSVKEGENLGIESKCGSAAYIKGQIPHIFQQVLGHGKNSVVILSREFNDIPDTAKKTLLDGLREKNSSVCVLNVSSKEIKEALLNHINSRMDRR